jgi:hypothetical protein
MKSKRATRRKRRWISERMAGKQEWRESELERIVSKQNKSSRWSCSPLKRGEE